MIVGGFNIVSDDLIQLAHFRKMKAELHALSDVAGKNFELVTHLRELYLVPEHGLLPSLWSHSLPDAAFLSQFTDATDQILKLFAFSSARPASNSC